MIYPISFYSFFMRMFHVLLSTTHDKFNNVYVLRDTKLHYALLLAFINVFISSTVPPPPLPLFGLCDPL